MSDWRPLPLPTLAPGQSGEWALRVLQELANGVRNARGAGPDYQVAFGRYLDWVGVAEVQLRSVFSGEAVVDALHTRRYWFLLGGGPKDELWKFLNSELDHQLAIIEQYQRQLRHEMDVFQLDEGEIAVVLDTNFFLHYKPIEHFHWNDYMEAAGHRLVIPAVVIKELDDKKYHPNKKLSRRARRTIQFLYEHRGEAHPEEPLALPKQRSVALQILLDPAGHRRAAAADDEILDRAEHLAAVVAGRLVVGTADYGAHLAAQVRGIKTWRPPASLSRDPADDVDEAD
jgi:hypothetical protein